MLKKTVKYVDYNGVEREEDFYFHLSEAELAEMELSETGGLSESIQKIINAKDNAAIIKIFKDIVLKSYGVKSADGRQFVKNDEVKAASKKVRDGFKYSDPMSHETLGELESRISNKVEKMKTETKKKDLIDEIEILVIERNKKCKILKG
jgi:hypothetical protein